MKKKTKVEEMTIELEAKLKLEKESHEKTSEMFRNAVSKNGELTSNLMELREDMDKLEKAVIANFVKVNTPPRKTKTSKVWMINQE